MLDRAGRFLREALARLRGDGYPADLLAGGESYLEPRTLERLGLRTQPFSEHTEPERLFVDDAIRMQIGVLARQLADGDVLPVLKGESGSGKTSLLIRLMTDHADDLHFFVARGNPRVDARRIVVDMLRVLVRPVPRDATECYADLTRRLRALVADGRPAVLVIDDADQLPDSEIDNLLHLNDSLRRTLGGRFRVLLAAEPAIELRLAARAGDKVRDGQLISADMRPLTLPRAGPFLDHKLRNAGLSGTGPFGDDDLARIHAAAGGLPRALEIAAAADLDARFGT